MRLIEFLLHLPEGFLNRSVRLRFDPHWPAQEWIDRLIGQGGWGAALWNALLIAAALALVLWIYRREQGGRRWRIAGGILRAALLLLVIALLNNPLIEQPRQRIEPSVLAILVDKSVSMSVKDAGTPEHPLSRLAAAQALLDAHEPRLLNELSQRHTLRLYEFDQSAHPLDAPDAPPPKTLSALQALKPTGPATHLTSAIRSVLEDLQGQRLAGIVLLTDGRPVPAPPDAAAIEAIKAYGVRLYPIPLGTAQTPRNLVVESMEVEEAAFVGDLVNVKAVLRADGYPQGVDASLHLINGKTDLPLLGADGKAAQQTLHLPPAGSRTVELQFKPDQVGPLDVEIKALPLPGELDDADNTRIARLQVLAARINVLYVDGYPRWDYRYLKTQLIRDRTVNISCLLLSADAAFAQEGDPPTEDFPGPITRFPESEEALLKYDVVLIGDVDPRRFTDAQLQMLSDFVSRKGGGLEMIAGPQFSPQAWRATPLAAVLPVAISARDSGAPFPPAAEAKSESPTAEPGFRPLLTPHGRDSGIFRFFADPQVNQRYIEKTLPPLFWYSRGLSVKPGVGQVLAEHPTDTGPDGKKAPLLVEGRFGAGTTLFLAVDGSWRWRFYTGESVFDTFWVQQIRHLARGRKLGQRKFIFTAGHQAYELGEPVRLNLRILDPDLLRQVPPETPVQILDAQGQLLASHPLRRQSADSDQYAGAFTADRPGPPSPRLQLPHGTSRGPPPPLIPPRLGLLQPQVDTPLLARLAEQTGGQVIPLDQAPRQLAALPSARKIIPLSLAHPLWDSPLVLILFTTLLTAEWITRKLAGMV